MSEKGARRKKHGAAWLRRAVQTASLGTFLWLLWRTTFPLSDAFPPVDSFLRLDPLLATGIPLVARAWIPALLPGLGVLLLTLLAGRVFCGYICPMGCTLNAARWLARVPRACRPVLPPQWKRRLPRVKFLLLALLLGAAALGVNLLFWASPMALVTRFYALVLDPLRLLLEQAVLAGGQNLWENFAPAFLAHVQVEPRRYDALFFTALLLAVIMGLEYVRPRFWCRCLCPAGALLALAALRPLWRRTVSRCTGCGQCARQCPTGAIAPAGQPTAHSECLACRACVDMCPVRGVTFALPPHAGPAAALALNAADSPALSASAPAPPASAIPCPPACAPPSLPSRRAFVAALGAGVLMGSLHLAELRSALATGKGLVQGPLPIRPPGAVPESEFLGRCVRCGQCMKVCPTNGLQPAWTETGMAGCLSPVLTPRRGPCEPDCNACGHVCPSAALRPLPVAQKHWAKIGTALVVQGRCLAWSMDKRCMVCQEVCPYGAIELVRREGHVAPVPVVMAQRCFGCGYCENHCPVRVSAVVVEAFHALRLTGGDYEAEARAQGLVLEPGRQSVAPEFDVPPGALPPGFTE